METIFDLKLWEQIQGQLSNFLNKQITFLDGSFNELVISGKQDYLRELIKHKNNNLYLSKLNELILKSDEDIFSFKNIDGTHDVVAKVNFKDNNYGFIFCGGFRLDDSYDFSLLEHKSGLEKEELLDAFSLIKKTTPEHISEVKSLLKLFLDVLIKTTNSNFKNNKKISNLIVIQKISQIAASNNNLDEMMQSIMNFIINYIDTPYFGISIFDEDKRKKYRFSTNLDLNSIDELVFKEISRKMGDIAISKIESKGIKSNQFIQSLIALPIFLRGKIIGVIHLYGKSLDSMDDDKNFLISLRDQLAIAISNALQFEEIKTLAVKDKLTGFYNRRYFMESFENDLKKESDKPVSLILMDIDDFGNYNNTNGHPAGDKLLKEVSALILDNLRKEDICGRYGGEEFIALLPEAKPSVATEIAERIRSKIENYPFEFREKQPFGKVTISLGLVTVMDRGLNVSEMIKQADESLYRAKKSGKNKFVNTIIVNKNMRPVDV